MRAEFSTFQDACAEVTRLRARLAAVVQVLTDWGVLADGGDFVGDSDFAEAIHDSGAWRLSRDLRAALATGATTNPQEGRI